MSIYIENKKGVVIMGENKKNRKSIRVKDTDLKYATGGKATERVILEDPETAIHAQEKVNTINTATQATQMVVDTAFKIGELILSYNIKMNMAGLTGPKGGN